MQGLSNRFSLLIFNEKTFQTVIEILNKERFILGRDKNSDLVLDSGIVSNHHGEFFKENDEWFYRDFSTNGTFVDQRHLLNTNEPVLLRNNTLLQIKPDEKNINTLESFSIIFTEGDYSNQEWAGFDLDKRLKDKIYIGRDTNECELFIDNLLISRKHGLFYRAGDDIYYQDLNSTNGTIVNGIKLKGSHLLRDRDFLVISNQKMLYSNGILFYMKPHSGTNLNIRNLTKRVNDSEHKGRKKTILNNVNLDVNAGELVAILGTSGAGKSTFLNCVNGYEEATSGKVLINNVDFYQNKNLIKKQIGYVPQEDLLRDELSVKSTLDYTAKLRLPKDTKKRERQKLIDNILDSLGIERELKSSKIQKLSGGQRKRVSIAMELISDPPIIFLDEPTSGLDPETETNLIEQLKILSQSSKKTLLVITHTIKNIDLFDKLLFLGPGGKVCFYGPPHLALKNFNVDDISEAYQVVRNQTDYYFNKYTKSFYNQV